MFKKKLNLLNMKTAQKPLHISEKIFRSIKKVPMKIKIHELIKVPAPTLLKIILGYHFQQH